MMQLPQRICLTGGGTAGHVMPHLALLPHCYAAQSQVMYIGTYGGIEANLLRKERVRYRNIFTGKLRRQCHWKTLFMPFAVAIGGLQALWHLWRFKPQVVFSKGGYVALPVVYAAWLLRIPCVGHESDMTLGLTNRLCRPLLKRLCVGFEATYHTLQPDPRVIYTGIPIRDSLRHGSPAQGLAHTGLRGDRPIVLVVGGSLGAQAINAVVYQALDALLAITQIIHITGPDAQPPAHRTGYVTYPFVTDPLPDLLACADLAISRAGANTLAEWLALAMPSILIPLPAIASRGDQIDNAQFFSKQGLATVIQQTDLTPKHLCDAVQSALRMRDAVRTHIQAHPASTDATRSVLRVLAETVTTTAAPSPT